MSNGSRVRQRWLAVVSFVVALPARGTLNRSIRHAIQLLVAFGLFGVFAYSGAANAAMSVSPSPSYNRDFTVTWSFIFDGTYNLEENINSAGWVLVQSSGYNSGSKAYTNKPLGNYQYRMRWKDVDSPNWVTIGGPVSVDVLKPATPSWNSSNVPTNDTGNFTIAWLAAAGANYYQLRERNNIGGTWSAWTVYPNITAPAVSKSITGKADASWEYQVRACSNGTNGWCGTYSATYTVDVARAPGMPGNVHVDYPISTHGGHTVLWNAPTSGTVVHYKIRQNSGTAEDVTGTSKAYGSLSYGTYSYEVKACNVVGQNTSCSSWTTAISSVIQVPPTFSINDVSASEGGVLGFSVTRNGPASTQYVVSYSTANGTAIEPGDYTSASSSKTFAPSQQASTQIISIQTATDTVYEGTVPENMYVNLSGTTAGSDNTGKGDITDLTSTPVFSIAALSGGQASEGGQISFRVTMTGGTSQNHSVSYRTLDGTARSTEDPTKVDHSPDYVAQTNVLTFTAGGPNTQDVTIQTRDESYFQATSVYEIYKENGVLQNEKFVVEILTPTNNAQIDTNASQATGVILDNDLPPDFGINLVGPQPTQEDDRQVTVYTQGAWAYPVTVEFTTEDGTALAGQDYVSTQTVLEFTPGGDPNQGVDIIIINNEIYEGDEQFTVKILNPSDPNVTISIASVPVVIMDTDDRPFFTIDSVAIQEGNIGNSSMVFTVTLDGASEKTHTIDYKFQAGSATTDDSDFVGTPGQLSFPPSLETPRTQTVTASAVGDYTVEPADGTYETFAVILEAQTGGAWISVGTGVGTILNDDFVPEIPTSIQVNFAGGLSDDLTVQWGAAGGTIPVTGYELERSLDGAGFSNVYTGPDLSKSFTDLAAGVYVYRVRACNQSGCSNWVQAAPVVVTPPPDDPGQLFTVGSSPPNSGVPGLTSGSFSVDAGGAANYVIPIAVPPGTAGMQPSLSLTYSSRSGNALLGVGWTLGGLSVITRCPATQAQDLFVDGIDFDADDRFCIDGERLVAINNGAYGANGTEYRTEIDGLTRVISYGTAGNGPQKFKVWTKSGQILEYGYTPDSRIEALGRSDASVRLWAVNKISDTVGNYMTVAYDEDPNGEYRPTQIVYTGNASSSPVLDPYATVTFEYVDRTDINVLYLSGSSIQTGKLLSHIRTYVDSELVRDYRLTYDTSGSGGASRITQIAECVVTPQVDECFPPTVFGWDGNGSLPDYDNPHALKPGWSDYHFITGDWNGDGRTDLFLQHREDGASSMYLANANGTMAVAGFNPDDWWAGEGSTNTVRVLVTGDWNGDGKTDIAKETITVSGSTPPFDFSHTITLYRSDGNGFVPVVTNGFSLNASSEGYSIAPMAVVGDWNGDGRSDLLLHKDDPDASQMYLANANGTMTATGFTQVWTNNNSRMVVGDWNGDGLSDIARSLNFGGAEIYLSTGSSFTAEGQVFCGDCKAVPADYNGDGYTDLFLKTTNNSTGAGFLHLSKGDGSFAQSGGYAGWGDEEAYAGDWNGDGKADLVRSDGHVFLSTGLQLVDAGISNTLAGELLSVGDWNGDGMPDLWAKPDADAQNATQYLTTHSGFDVINTITNGLGVTSLISYSPLTDGNVYTPGMGAAHPEFDVRAPMYVVSAVDTDNGVGGQRRTNYTYTGAKVHIEGRGFLGFATMTALDVATNIQTKTTYEQVFPYVGLVAETEQRLGSTLIGKVTTDYSVKTPHAGVSFPYASTVVKEDREIIGTWIKTTTTESTYDNYGNPNTILVTIAGGGETFTTFTDNTYTNDTVNWFLGRLTRAEVTQYLPTNGDPKNGTCTITTIRTCETRASAFDYDPVTGLLIQEVVEPDTPALRLQTDYTHDDFGNRETVTVSGGSGATAIASRTTTTQYDTRGQFPATVTNALGHIETRTWDGRYGTPKTLVGPNLLMTEWEYDVFGRQTREIRADGTATVVQRAWCTTGIGGTCPAGGVLKVITTTSGAAATVVITDKFGREIRTGTVAFDRRVSEVRTQYNPLGQVEKKSRPYFNGGVLKWHEFTYDDIGRVQTETGPNGALTSTGYAGLTVTVTNANNQANIRTVNARGELVEAVDAAQPTGNVTQYAYDPFGNLIEVIADVGGQNVTTTNTYNIRGHKLTMTDPDMGFWVYAYNALGELISQTDAKGQTATMSYDKLGRMVSRTDEVEGLSTWVYDHEVGQTYQTGQGQHSIGKLVRVTGAEGDENRYQYDALGRLITTTTWIDDNANGTPDLGEEYVTRQDYDFLGRVSSITYPESAHHPLGFTVLQSFTVDGYLRRLVDADSLGVYWEATAQNAAGQLTQAELRNGITSTWSYDDNTGLIDAIVSESLPGQQNIQNYQYDFDFLGNLTRRDNFRKGVNETLVYDTRNRLKEVHWDNGTIQATQTAQYDAIGNLKFKSDISSSDYLYGSQSQSCAAAGPHAVTEVGGHCFTYDANGNQTSGWNFTASPDGRARTLSWTSFNKPRTITEDGQSLTFHYGADRARFRQVNAFTGLTTHYIGGLYEKQVAGSTVTHVHYLLAGGTAVGIYKSVGTVTAQSPAGVPSGAPQVRYLHRDHLGSVTEITDETGVLVEELAYDAWGRRRSADWGEVLTSPPLLDTLRGFTHHEMLDDVALIHMNGRVYDPALGRFLSADPYVQFPANLQSYNRYSYVLNNPLSFTDPSGHFLAGLVFAAVGALLVTGNLDNVFAFLAQNFQIVFAIGLATLIPNPYLAGFAAGIISTGGNLKAGIIGALTGGAYAIPNVGMRIAVSSLVGGVGARLQGGKFLSGFLSSGFSAGFGAGAQKFLQNAHYATKLIATSVAGGLAAELGGGKFKNGAVTGALAYAVASGVNMARRVSSVISTGNASGGFDVEFGSGLEDLQRIWNEYGAEVLGDMVSGGYRIPQSGEISFELGESIDEGVIGSFSGVEYIVDEAQYRELLKLGERPVALILGHEIGHRIDEIDGVLDTNNPRSKALSEVKSYDWTLSYSQKYGVPRDTINLFIGTRNAQIQCAMYSRCGP